LIINLIFLTENNSSYTLIKNSDRIMYVYTTDGNIKRKFLEQHESGFINGG